MIRRFPLRSCLLVLALGLAVATGVGTAEGAGKINVNAATAAELARVPGLDAKIAVRIIARRSARGPFRNLDELLDVEGVTKMTLISAVEFLEAGPAPPPPAPAPLKKLDLNKASFSEFLLLPEMTPRAAKSIVDFREKNGGFRAVDDLGLVPNLDKRLLIGLLDRVMVSGAAVAAATPTPEEGFSGSWVSKIEQPSPAATATSVPLEMGDKIDINSADQKTLERLPDIGPVMAQRIIDYRKANGPFKDIDALQGVRGVGAQRLTALRPWITTTGGAAPRPTVAMAVKTPKPAPTPKLPVEVAMVRPTARPESTRKPEPVRTEAPKVSALPAITPDGRVNINVAGVDDLLTLPRMTRAVAVEIVDHRTKNGPFHDSHAIVDVPSIGEATYARIREKITTGN